LFFAVSILPLVREVASMCDWSHWYLDDAILCGSADQLATAVDLIQSKASDIGLVLNLHKSQLWSPSPVVQDGVLGIARVACAEGVKVLGTPIGSSAFVDGYIASTVQNLEDVIGLLPALSCPHSAFLLLKYCLSACKVMHLLRSLPYLKGAHLAQRSTSIIRDALSVIVGVPLSELQWELARLPTSLGGVGLLDPSAVHSAAYLSSLCASRVTSASFSLPVLKFPTDFKHAVSWVGEVAPSLSATVVGIPSLQVNLADEVALDRWCCWKKQSFWSEKSYRFLAEEFDFKAPSRMSSFRSLSAVPHSGDWLVAVPDSLDAASLSSREWQYLLRWRLCLTFARSSSCPGCGLTQDAFGDHAVTCTSMGLYRRHNYMRDALLRLCADAGIVAHANGYPLPQLGDRPADIFIDNFEGSEPVALDLSVVSGLQPSRSSASAHPGDSANKREDLKRCQYAESCSAVGWRFMPFVLETTGACSHGVHKVMAFLANYTSARCGESKQLVAARLWQSLSLALAKAVADQLIGAFGSYLF